MPLGATKHKGVITFSLAPELEKAASDYLAVREKEGRLLEDEIVAKLPKLDAGHPLSGEFTIRAKSAKRLRKWLDQQEPESRVLELGCGNGWLLHYLIKESGRTGMGVDINRPELEQAAHLFDKDPILWVRGDVFDLLFPNQFVDTIVVASAVQYFESLPLLIDRLLELLHPAGTIHFLDSPWYRTGEQASASERSLEYYRYHGLPEMAQHYHHHTLDDLEGYRWKLVYNPQSLKIGVHRKLGRLDSPFPWIIIRK